MARARYDPRPVGYLLAIVSLVAVVQGMAWVGPRRGPPRPRRGILLAVLGVLGLGLGLLISLVPSFFA